MYKSGKLPESSGLAWLPWCLLVAGAFYVWQQAPRVTGSDPSRPALLRTADFSQGLQESGEIGRPWTSSQPPSTNGRYQVLKPQHRTAPPLGPQYASSRQAAPRRQLAVEESTNIEVFRRCSSSVVFIKTAGVTINPFTLDMDRVKTGSGSGFVWDQQGHVVTNFHVVLSSRSRPRIADQIQVLLADQSSWKARVVGVAPDKDMAVLKIDAPPEVLKPLPLGVSYDLLVGQKVLAIGSPFGLDQTLTTGIISGLEREIQSVTRRKIDGVVQTDAAINPGNSGGPLLDSSGRLIGVNTAIYSPSGAYAGIGFAIPVDTVSRYVPQLIENGEVIRPWLGVSLAHAAVTRRHGIEGVLVIRVADGGTAAEAGVRPTRFDDNEMILGDVIVAMDHTKINTSDDLLDYLDEHEIGDRITITVIRDIASDERKVQLRAVLKSQSTE